MGHIIELTDEQYETLRQVAVRKQETPERLIESILNALAETKGTVYYTDAEFLGALGADDDELAALAELDADADE